MKTECSFGSKWWLKRIATFHISDWEFPIVLDDLRAMAKVCLIIYLSAQLQV